MGQFFSKALEAAGVEVQVDKDNSHHTGTVMVGGLQDHGCLPIACVTNGCMYAHGIFFW